MVSYYARSEESMTTNLPPVPNGADDPNIPPTELDGGPPPYPSDNKAPSKLKRTTPATRRRGSTLLAATGGNSQLSDTTQYSRAPDAEQRQSVQSSILFIKQVVAVVIGLTVINAVVNLVTKGSYTSVKIFNEFTIQPFIYFSLLIANVIRFYHGNNRHIDDTYVIRTRKRHDIRHNHKRVGLDLFVAVSESVILGALSFYMLRPSTFLILFGFLLIFDMIWFLVGIDSGINTSESPYVKGWLINNIIAVLALLVTALTFFTLIPTVIEPYRVYNILVAILVINTLWDFKISWDFYFAK